MTASTWIRWSVVAVLLVGTLWLGNIVANQVEGWTGHALSHLVVGVPAAVFAVIFVRLRGRQATGLGWAGKAGLELPWFWSYPGLVDSSSLSGDVFGGCAPFIVTGAQVAQG